MAEETRITLGGLVGKPASLSLDDLRGAVRVELEGRLTCPPGTPPGAGTWEGASLAALVAAAGPDAGAEYVLVGSGEFITAFALESLERRNVILADTLDGAALRTEAGGPVRLMFSQGACFDTIKAVEFVDLTADASRATVRDTIKARRAAGERSATRRSSVRGS
jgi:DMSO/TMAO reductase YedYZ molybdopterin-dependent catalytic subunit